jgi:hypothetical protein
VLSASKIPKNTPKEGSNWGCSTSVIGENGKAVYGPDRNIMKTKVWMADGMFNGMVQSLYFLEGHPQEGVFKGMAIILEECGFVGCVAMKVKGKKGGHSGRHTACADFKLGCVTANTPNCCCCRILYNQPDFVHVKSQLEQVCNAHGYQVLFLPKFHCKLNFIEQCWGYSKRVYQQYPASSKEADLEKNVLSALESIPLESMRR